MTHRVSGKKLSSSFQLKPQDVIAKDVTAWQVPPPGAGRTNGCGVSPGWGHVSTAWAAATARDTGALQDGLLSQGFQFVYSQDQERILA